MARDIEVIDADGHITEEDDQLREHMEAPYRNRGATIYPRDNWDRSLGGTLGTRAKDAKKWLDAMDDGGVASASVGFASRTSPLPWPRRGTTSLPRSFRR